MITFVLRRILFIFGTRPEAIKLCPVVLHMRRHPDQFDARVCVTGQHREMLDQVLAAFDVDSDHDLDVMRPGQTLFQSTARILAGLEEVFEAETPDMVLVRGGYDHDAVRGAGSETRDACVLRRRGCGGQRTVDSRHAGSA